MKFIIRQILLVLTLIVIIHESQCDRRLSRVFEEITEKFAREFKANNEIGLKLDIDCVKDFFKLPQNRNMMINQIEEVFFPIAAAMQCYEEDKVFGKIFDSYIHDGLKKRFNCVNWHLKQLEPTSKLIENFEISDVDLKECKERLPINELVGIQNKIESTFGPLNIYTCGAVSEIAANDLLKFVGKGAVIKFGDISEELKKSEKEKLKNYFKDLTIRTANCVMTRFEDDPEGK